MSGRVTASHDVPGDSAWIPGDGEGSYDDPGVFNFENSALRTDRIGCFVNENGIANTRIVCDKAYIGVLGTGRTCPTSPTGRGGIRGATHPAPPMHPASA